MPNKTLRVLIVDNHLVWRNTLEMCLSSLPDMQVVGIAPDGKSAIDICPVLRPDLVMLDMDLPDMNGFNVGRALLQQQPGLLLIGVTSDATLPTEENIRASGFQLIVPKDRLLDHLSLTSLSSSIRHTDHSER